MTPRGSARTVMSIVFALMLVGRSDPLIALGSDGSLRDRPPFSQTPTPLAEHHVGDGTAINIEPTDTPEPDVPLVNDSPLIVPVATRVEAPDASEDTGRSSAIRPKPEARAFDNPAGRADQGNNAGDNEEAQVPEDDKTVPRLDDSVLRWLPEIMASAEANEVPPELIAGVMRLESDGNPNIISPDGARGLMQIMPDQLLGQGIGEYLWHDPATNIMAGGYELLERSWSFGAWEGAVGSYFGFGCDVFGTCTAVYVQIVFDWAAYYKPIIEAPRNSGFGILPADWVAPPIVPFVEAAPNPPEAPPTKTPTPVASASPTATPTTTGTASATPTSSEPIETEAPTEEPTTEPTAIPTEVPTEVPTEIPTEVPTGVPTEVPTEEPTDESVGDSAAGAEGG